MSWILGTYLFVSSVGSFHINRRYTEFTLLQTPSGYVQLAHWSKVLNLEKNGFALQSVGYKLTETHLRPKPFQKMNVALAYQVSITCTHVLLI